DFVGQAEFEQIPGGDFEGFGGFAGGGAVFPQNGRATFRADDGVVSIFQQEHAVGHADTQGAAGAAFADDDGDDRHGEEHHLAQIDGDGFGDVPFFGADAGVSAGGVDEGDDGQAEPVGQAHEAKGLAVALGMGGTEVAPDVLLGVASLLRADD